MGEGRARGNAHTPASRLPMRHGQINDVSMVDRILDGAVLSLCTAACVILAVGHWVDTRWSDAAGPRLISRAEYERQFGRRTMARRILDRQIAKGGR